MANAAYSACMLQFASQFPQIVLYCGGIWIPIYYMDPTSPKGMSNKLVIFLQYTLPMEGLTDMTA